MTSDPEEIFRRFESLKDRFEAADEPGEPLAADFEALGEEAERLDQPGIDVVAREAERYASHIRDGFPPLDR